MCSLNILSIVSEIALLVNKVMHANFVKTNRMYDENINRLLEAAGGHAMVSDGFEVAQPQEIRGWIQKAFLLICELYQAKCNDTSSREVLANARVYIPMLANQVSTMPGYVKIEMDSATDEVYRRALDALDLANWKVTKSELIVCASCIYTEISSLKPHVEKNSEDMLDKSNKSKWSL